MEGLERDLAAEQTANLEAHKQLTQTRAALAARDAQVADSLRASAAASAEAQAYVEQVPPCSRPPTASPTREAELGK